MRAEQTSVSHCCAPQFKFFLGENMADTQWFRPKLGQIWKNKNKMIPEHWKLVHSSLRWYILWIWKKKLKKNIGTFFFRFFFENFFLKIFWKKNVPKIFFKFFFQIHKIYHLGLLCTNFQCSGIILFFFQIWPNLGSKPLWYIRVLYMCADWKDNPTSSNYWGFKKWSQILHTEVIEKVPPSSTCERLWNLCDF